MSSAGLDRYGETFCAYCETPLVGMRSDARYCSGRCRTAAYEERHAPAEVDPEWFWSLVDKNGECWVWQGKVQAKGGYGFISLGPVTVLAHRWTYESAVGPIPEDLQLDHLCRVPACVRPSHLEAVTPAENTRRGWAARRAGQSSQALRSSDGYGREGGGTRGASEDGSGEGPIWPRPRSAA